MTSQTTRIIRYSTQGFKPQYQSEHLKNIDHHLNVFNINDFLEHLKHIIQKQHEKHLYFYKEHCQDSQSGVLFYTKNHSENNQTSHNHSNYPKFQF